MSAAILVDYIESNYWNENMKSNFKSCYGRVADIFSFTKFLARLCLDVLVLFFGLSSAQGRVCATGGFVPTPSVSVPVALCVCWRT